MISKMTEKDPGISGKKLSKSSDDTFERHVKELGKVLDSQLNWIRASQLGDPSAPDLLVRWKKKSEWFQKEFGC